MIVDFHAHVFPPKVRDNRREYLRLDPSFRELYRSASVRLATADDLLRSMNRSRVQATVVLNFAWRDPALCRETNDYILEAAARSDGRLIPFCTVQPSDKGAQKEIERCVAGGARGLGEFRPANQGYTLNESGEAELLAWAARAYGLPLLFHVSEPTGHAYPGKGGLPLDQLYEFLDRFPGATVIAAHWGGGLPFYALMPEVREALASTYFDTAATSLLYDTAIYRQALELIGAERILFGSDYPLLPQRRCIREVEDAGIDGVARRLIMGENACRLLGLDDVRART